MSKPTDDVLGFLPAMAEAISRTQRDYGAYNAAHFPAHPGEFFALELAGEAGELANKEKKRWLGREVPLEDLAEEAADVLVATINYCNSRGIDLGRAVAGKMTEIERRRAAKARKNGESN